jgi:hypothetical protein
LISSPLSLFLCQSLFFTFFLYHCSSSCFSVPQPSVAGHPKSLLLHCSNSGSKCSVPKVRHFSIIFIYTLGRIGDWSPDERRCSIPGGGWEFFSSTPRPERLWCPPSLLTNGYQGLFPWG